MENKEYQENGTSKIIKTIGFIMLAVGIFASVMYLMVINENRYGGLDPINFIIAAAIFLCSLAQGYLFIGLAELIEISNKNMFNNNKVNEYLGNIFLNSAAIKRALEEQKNKESVQ